MKDWKMMKSLKKALQKWLEIEKPKDLSLSLKDHQSKVDETLTEFRKTLEQFCEITCTVCSKKIVTYPFGGGYYREADGSVLCSSACIDKRQEEKK